MALTIPTPPEAVMAEFLAGLPAFLWGPDFGAAGQMAAECYLGNTPQIPTLAGLGSVNGVPLVHDAQQVFVLGLGAGADHAIGAAAPAGWRLFVGNAQYNCVMGRLTQRPNTMTWSLTAAHYGDPASNRDRVWELLEASQALHALPEVGNIDYGLRVLAMPALNLEAFWLKAATPAQSDLVVPFPAAPNQLIRELNTATSYPMPEFLMRIAPLAKRRLSVPALFGS